MILQFHTPEGVVEIDTETATDNELALINMTREEFNMFLASQPRDLYAEIDELRARLDIIPSPPVDIGAEAISRPSGWASDTTLINKDIPATIAGEITSVSIFAAADLTGFRVGTFYVVSGDTLKCRVSEAIAGTIVSGSKVTKAVSIAVQIGDYIGCFYSLGVLGRHTSGFAGVWYATGNNVNPGVEANYGLVAGDVVSLGGYIM